MYFDGKFWVDLWRKLFIDPVTFIHLKNSHLITCWNAILIHSKFLYGLVTCKTDIRIAASLYKSESKVLIHAQPTQQLSDHFEMILERLSFQQNYNQYFVNAFIINLNKYLHFRCERGPIKTLLMFHRKCSISKDLTHIWWVIPRQSGWKYKLPYHSYVFSTRLLFYLLIFWISFGPALKCMMNPSYPAHHIVIYEACLHICLLIRYFTLTEFN